MIQKQALLAFHEGRRARKKGETAVPPEPWRWFPLSRDWIRGWNEADAEDLKKQRQNLNA